MEARIRIRHHAMLGSEPRPWACIDIEAPRIKLEAGQDGGCVVLFTEDTDPSLDIAAWADRFELAARELRAGALKSAACETAGAS